MQSEIFENKFEGFILAGGKSSRMGKDKAFLKIGDETFVERAANVLSPVCENPVRIVLNQNQSAAEFPPHKFIRDIYPERGALGGIHAAFSNAKSEWSIILACDLPLVSSEIIRELAQIALNLPRNIAAIVPIQPDGKLQPLCALYRPSKCLPQLSAMLQTNTSNAVREFLQLIPAFYPDFKKTSVNDETVFFNVNQPDDYKLLIRK